MEPKLENAGGTVEDPIITYTPNVIHIIYPNGRSLPPHMLDPDTGNYWNTSDKGL